MTKKVRWGVIGAGGIADRRTIPGMVLAKNAQLVAVMEIRSEFAEQLRKKWNAKRAYTTVEALLADPEIDAVYIASPVALHSQQAKAAADAGKHILLEKPLALTAEEAQEVVDYCKAKGVKVAAGFMMRFGSYVQAMKQAISEGKIGRVVSAYAHFTGWLPDSSSNWRKSRKDSGGGSLMDMGVHCIDLIQYIVGSPTKQAVGFHDTLSFHYEVEDSSIVMLRLENGCQCMIQSNFNIPDAAAKWRLEFFGDRGHLMGSDVIGQIDGGKVDALFCDQDQNCEDYTFPVELGNMYTREIESFGASILDGISLAVPAEDAVHVQRIIEAAYRSNDEKRVLDI